MEHTPLATGPQLEPKPPFSHIILITGARTFDNETAIKEAFNSTWRTWGPASIRRPLMIAGHASKGADAMAERLWKAAGFEAMIMPADWGVHGRKAGFIRNQQMVDTAVKLKAQGAEVVCTAFMDVCKKPGCPGAGQQQLMPQRPGHYSHGTVHTRRQALQAGIAVLDIFQA